MERDFLRMWNLLKILLLISSFVVFSGLFFYSLSILRDHRNHDNDRITGDEVTRDIVANIGGSFKNDYRCSGVCYCEESSSGENRRRNLIISSTKKSSANLVFFVSAVTSIIAFKLAKERLDQECFDSFSEEEDEECDSLILSQVDDCEYVLSEEEDFSTLKTEKLQPLDPKEGKKKNIILVSCGSFNPITLAHLRLCETARDVLRENFDINAIGAYISPVNDAYGKKGLAKAHHRTKMVGKSVESSDWIELDDWEANQDEYVKTRICLERFERLIQKDPRYQNNVKVSLLMGTDMFETLPSSEIWDQDDVAIILERFGIVVMEREGSDSKKILDENEILRENEENIFFIPSLIKNDISASKIREFVKRGFSTKYLIQDCVREYIDEYNLYLD